MSLSSFCQSFLSLLLTVSHHATDLRVKKALAVFLCFSVVMIGLSQEHWITGAYFLGDHYLDLGFAVNWLFLIGVLINPTDRPYPRYAKCIALALLAAVAVRLVFVYSTFSNTNVAHAIVWFSPSFFILGTYVASASVVLFGKRLGMTLAISSIILGAAIGAIYLAGSSFSQLSKSAEFPSDELVRIGRSLDGSDHVVVLADAKNSEWIVRDTGAYVYYAPSVTMDYVSTDELTRRMVTVRGILGDRSEPIPCWLLPNSIDGRSYEMLSGSLAFPYIQLRSVRERACSTGGYSLERLPEFDPKVLPYRADYLLFDSTLDDPVRLGYFLERRQYQLVLQTRRYRLFKLSSA